MRMIVIAATILLMMGCATDPGWHWERQGSTRQQYDMDEGQCKAQAIAGTGGYVTMGTIMILHSCMQGKGWQKVPNIGSRAS